MPRPSSDKRARLTAAAVRLAATRGLASATLADIAHEAQVPPGSVYYYFRTKDDVASAVVEGLATEIASLTARLDELATPAERLTGLVQAYADDAERLVSEGSALTLLGAQARWTSTGLAARAAEVVDATIQWIAAQFEDVGFASDPSRARALHLLTGLEGAAALAHALGDATPVLRETAHLERWISSTAS